MNGREGVGVAAVLAGILIIVGAAKGTWRQVWTDLTGQPAPTPSTSSNAAGQQQSNASPPIKIGGGGITIGPGWLPVPVPTPIGGISLQGYQQSVIPYTPAPGVSGYGAVPVQ